jgi:penicillin-binding protein activator
MKKFALLLSLVFLITACGGGTQYRDPAKDKGSAEFGPKEIKMTVNKLAGSMYVFLKDDWKQAAFLQVKKFRNKTSDNSIDTQLISNEIAEYLIKKRIYFIDDSLTKEAIEEMQKGMTGLIDPEAAIPVGMMKSPNLYLTGEVNDNNRTVDGKRLQYLVVSMKLVNVKTGVDVWRDKQEFLKATSKNKVSF